MGKQQNHLKHRQPPPRQSLKPRERDWRGVETRQHAILRTELERAWLPPEPSAYYAPAVPRDWDLPRSGTGNAELDDVLDNTWKLTALRGGSSIHPLEETP